MCTRQHNFRFELVDEWHIRYAFLTLWCCLSFSLDLSDCVSHYCVIFSDEAAALKHDCSSLGIQVQGGSVRLLHVQLSLHDLSGLKPVELIRLRSATVSVMTFVKWSEAVFQNTL